MYNPISSIIRQVTRTPDEPLNILTFPTHERYETGLCLTGHNFYAYRAEGIKDWNTDYAPLPDNYTLLDPRLELQQIPDYVEFDLILSQNKFGQFQHAYPLSKQMRLPVVSLEHTLPMPQWSEAERHQLKNMRGLMNVFISEYSLGQWNWDNMNDTTVVHHMVDTDVFSYAGYRSDIQPKNHILSVVNDWMNRDWCCNFQGWQRITNGLPVRVLGDTPGLSEPAPSTEALVREYQQARIFLNTSTISPVPTALLEAMACGCAVVSTATCMIPEIIENGVNGFISNDEFELRKQCELLLNDPSMALKMGKAAVETIEKKFNKERFVDQWNTVFRSVL
jgi:hypothetical protein